MMSPPRKETDCASLPAVPPGSNGSCCSDLQSIYSIHPLPHCWSDLQINQALPGEGRSKGAVWEFKTEESIHRGDSI